MTTIKHYECSTCKEQGRLQFDYPYDVFNYRESMGDILPCGHKFRNLNEVTSKVFSVSDVEQLQKELKERLIVPTAPLGTKVYAEPIIDEVFNNFKGK